mgnify:CR=1 FL=1
MEHDKIREIEKNLRSQYEARKTTEFQRFTRIIEETAISLAETLANHFYKENNILFPTALQVVGKSEWSDLRQQFDELGYCCFTPETAKIAFEEVATPVSQPAAEGVISLETGTLSIEEVDTILDTLPLDITFVDRDDTVRYFNQSKDRVFPRTKAIIGRKVQQCHPQKSVHVVNQILDDFRAGRKDTAQFWINLKGRLIYIRYFAVRDEKGEYQGTLEVVQDVTGIRALEGERRLLDEEE